MKLSSAVSVLALFGVPYGQAITSLLPAQDEIDQNINTQARPLWHGMPSPAPLVKDSAAQFPPPKQGNQEGRQNRRSANPYASVLNPRMSKLMRRYDPDETADDDLWTKNWCKGVRLTMAMKESDEDAGKRIEDKRTPPSAASVWQGDLTNELNSWGWTTFNDGEDEDLRADQEWWNVQDACAALKLNTKPKSDGGDNIPVHVEHWDKDKKDDKGNPIPLINQYYKVGDKAFRATGSQYKFVVNTVGGVIYQQYVTSPKHAARDNWHRDANQDELPALNKLSDVFWGYWNRNNPSVGNIRYFWVEGVVNDDTNMLIARALKEANKKLDHWPGATFGLDSKAGQALLGSENGAPFAWFLIQHKAQLGNKWIPKVQVFMKDDAEVAEFEDPHMIFYVDTAPAPGEIQDDKDEGYESGEQEDGSRNIVRMHTMGP